MTACFVDTRSATFFKGKFAASPRNLVVMAESSFHCCRADCFFVSSSSAIVRLCIYRLRNAPAGPKGVIYKQINRFAALARPESPKTNFSSNKSSEDPALYIMKQIVAFKASSRTAKREEDG